jgi:enediyne biosynthesis protein E3
MKGAHMLFSVNKLRRALLGISIEETTFVKRGFYRGNARAQQKLELIGRIFVQGYHAALDDDHFDILVPSLESIEEEYRGFAYEGAAMGLALLDYFSPRQQRLIAFMQGPGASHIYMLHVGAGWTLGRLPRSSMRLARQFDPLLGWLVLDGYGFHQGYFAWPRFIQGQKLPKKLSGYALHAFDQGLGRSLWFVKGADASQIISAIRAFPSSRQSDLWSGIGLACAYAGGGGDATCRALLEAAGNNQAHLAQGAAFAAKARQRAGNSTEQTNRVCQILSGYSSNEAARITDECLEGLSQNEQAYESWRSRIRARLMQQKEESHSSLR